MRRAMTSSMRRASWCAFGCACVLLLGLPFARAGEEPSEIVLVVDADDDDDDGVADRASARPGERALARLHWVPREHLAPREHLVSPPGSAPESGSSAPFRFHVRGKEVGLQGLRPGAGELSTRVGPVPVSVLELRALDAEGASVDLARSHASLSRALPAPLGARGEAATDVDALRWLVIGPRRALPDVLTVSSFGADGRLRDRAAPSHLADVPCPPQTALDLACRLSAPLRASTDPVDRDHPAAAGRSILAEVGGRLRIEVALGAGVSLRVGGPRGAAGHEVGRYRAVVRTHILRTGAGSPAVGADDEEAIALLRRELAGASALWGQCGIHLGPVEELDIQVRDAPPPHMVAVGCGTGQRASGGVIRLTVDGRALELPSRPGELPAEFAVRLAERIEALGFRARVSVNAATQRAAKRTADVLVRGAAGGFVPLGTPGDAPASTDPSLPVCLGEVELADGLQHFDDFDAGAGTVEERALIKAFEDDDPATIELFVVPSFGGSGRIGESFLFGPGASLQNVIVLDRGGIRAGGRSFALAHELGHVLLDMPGHPDDFGVDTPSSLMDADAADATIFGPRRLSVEECERALRQSGPGAPIPLLTPWPLFSEGTPAK